MTSGDKSSGTNRIRGGQSGSFGEGGRAGGQGDIGACQPSYRGAGLASPKSAVLSKVKVGDTLALDAQPQGNYYLLYAVKSGVRAGVVTHKFIDQIIRCIVENGHIYVAYVTALDGGSCSLEIRMER